MRVPMPFNAFFVCTWVGLILCAAASFLGVLVTVVSDGKVPDSFITVPGLCCAVLIIINVTGTMLYVLWNRKQGE